MTNRKQREERFSEVEWVTSREVEKCLCISGCELMHLRVAGKLRFEKRGNAFLYWRSDVEG